MENPKKNTTKVLIIGSGSAGYTAAIYAGRANLKPVLITGMQPGGQLTITTDVENYPGFPVIQGPELMQQMGYHAEKSGASILTDEITSIDASVYPFKCVGMLGEEYYAYSIVFATGAQAKWLGVKGEDIFKGRGVSACATCDAAFFKGKVVAVVGGGNTAVEEAMHLSRTASKVFLIHRRNKLRAEAIMQERLFQNNSIEVIWDSVVKEIIGEDSVHSLLLESTKDGSVSTLDVKGVFVAIGHTPNTDVVRNMIGNKVELDNDGYVVTSPNSTLTSCQGIFAAGDVMDKVYRQAVVAAGTGCMAAIDAGKFLAEKGIA